MNWEAIGAGAELLGALGVIVSVIYLAVQIKLDARARRAESSHHQVTSFTDIQLQLASDEALTNLFLDGLKSYKNLNPTNASRFGSVIGPLFRSFEENYLLWKSNTLDVHVWEGLEGVIVEFMSAHGVNEWWKTRKHWYSTEFASYIESIDTSNRPFYPLHDEGD